MNKKERLSELALECSQGLQASMKLTSIILERHLADILPESRQISMQELNEITDYDYFKLKKYMGNEYYDVGRKEFTIKADIQYLSKHSKSHCKFLISKFIVPTHITMVSFEELFNAFSIDVDFTAEESEFIDLMINELLSVASITEFSRQIFENDLSDFNSPYNSNFYLSTKRVYNDILQKKLHAGDNIMTYFTENLEGYEIIKELRLSCKFDFFFDKDGILKCDLDTNRDILIKNFLNMVLYNFSDPCSRTVLLQKLNNKYPIFINEL